MRVDPRFLNWGLFFILLGGIPLAVDQGWIAADAIAGWWRYWPLILVGIGVGLVLRRTPVHFLGGLIVAATFGLMLGSALAGGVGGRFDLACTSDRAGTSFTPSSGSLGPNGAVRLEMSCGDLKVTTTQGPGWTLSGTTPDGRPPRVVAGAGALAISSDRSGIGFFGSGGGAETWDLALPLTTGDLAATLSAGSARLDLAGARLGGVSLTTNAGSMVVDLGSAAASGLSATVNAGSTKVTFPSADLGGSVTVNAGSFEFCVPSGVGLRIESTTVLGSNNFAERGLVQTGSTWTSPSYLLAPIKIDLSATANLGSLELDPEGGCK
jgi:hypothetical protein